MKAANRTDENEHDDSAAPEHDELADAGIFWKESGTLCISDTVRQRLLAAEAAMDAAADERRTVELARQNERMNDVARYKSELVANLSHELRTPLNAIIGFAELLLDGQVPPASPEHADFLRSILDNGRRLLRLIDDVLDLARIEAGKLELHAEHADAARLTADVCGSLRAAAARKRLHLEIDADPSVNDVSLDPVRFKQAVYNLVSNAIKFTPAGGRVTVRVGPEDEGTFRVEVEDTGVGISQVDVARLFVAFEQLDGSTSKRHEGAGLGLVLTRRIVEAHGGRVGVQSVPGKGSLFYAVLPRRSGSAAPPA